MAISNAYGLTNSFFSGCTYIFQIVHHNSLSIGRRYVLIDMVGVLEKLVGRFTGNIALTHVTLNLK